VANRHASAIKRNRQNSKRRARNRAVRAQVRTDVRKVREAVASRDVTAANTELQHTIKQLSKAASKGVLHKNAAARRISRLSKQVAALQPTS
jgi:small subunit ribosomal protein S20